TFGVVLSVEVGGGKRGGVIMIRARVAVQRRNRGFGGANRQGGGCGNGRSHTHHIRIQLIAVAQSGKTAASQCIACGELPGREQGLARQLVAERPDKVLNGVKRVGQPEPRGGDGKAGGFVGQSDV